MKAGSSVAGMTADAGRDGGPRAVVLVEGVSDAVDLSRVPRPLDGVLARV
jgi:hypothetical protein